MDGGALLISPGGFVAGTGRVKCVVIRESVRGGGTGRVGADRPVLKLKG